MNKRIDCLLAQERRTGHRQIRPRRNQPRTRRQLFVCIAQPSDQRNGQAGSSAVATNCNVRSRNILVLQETPCCQRVVIRRGEWMLRRQSIANSQGPHSSGPTRLSHQTTMTEDRTGTITAAVKKHQDTGGIAAGNDRPFAW